MEFIYIGQIVNTHGIKGEVRIISDFDYKDKVFIKGMNLYLGKRKQPLKINSYRTHKNFDMVTFDGITDINDAIALKGDLVYIDKSSIKIDGYFDEELIGFDVYSEYLIGKVSSIIKTKAHKIILVNGNKNYMIPYVKEYINKIEDGKIYINAIKGLLDED